MSDVRLVLASASPRRRELLAQIGVLPVSIHSPEVDEAVLPGESAGELVERLARRKAEAIAGSLDGESRCAVLAADTVVVLDTRILGKPDDKADFINMFQSLSDRDHQVLSGVAVHTDDGMLTSVVVATSVRFCRITARQAEAYWLTGEPVDKAGGYGIQGCAARFVEDIRGSYSNVVGLPLFETARMLAAVGVLRD